MKALMYTTLSCPFCTLAKRLLDEKGIEYTEIRVDLDEKERERMIAITGRRTVPQIFIDDKHIGGYDDLYSYLKNSGAS